MTNPRRNQGDSIRFPYPFSPLPFLTLFAQSLAYISYIPVFRHKRSPTSLMAAQLATAKNHHLYDSAVMPFHETLDNSSDSIGTVICF
jgi:hypothetical protein